MPTINNSDLKIVLYVFNDERTETTENISFQQSVFKGSMQNTLSRVKRMGYMGRHLHLNTGHLQTV